MKQTQLKTWILFASCLIIAICALSWISYLVVHYENEQNIAASRERLRANLRLAVWRIDSLIAPVLAEEAVRPSFHYQPINPFANTLSGKDNDELAQPSPILKTNVDWISLNFNISQNGKWSSPQVPPIAFSNDSVGNALPGGYLSQKIEDLGILSSGVDEEELKNRLQSALESQSEELSNNWFVLNDGDPGGNFRQSRSQSSQILENAQPQQQVQQEKQVDYGLNQTIEGQEDLNARQRAVNRYTDQQFTNNYNTNPMNYAPVENLKDTRMSRLTPLWFPLINKNTPALILARLVNNKKGHTVQGALVDWPLLKSRAEAEIEDIFPKGELAPREASSPLDPDRALAVIPAELNPGETLIIEDSFFFTPVRLGLILTWFAFLSGSIIVGMGMNSLLALNRRRLDFVSAVTHELRTPLTTFTMYTEMLRDDMVPEAKKNEYYSTLFDESLRLSHLVQNVLDYSRLESQKIVSKKISAPMASHFQKILPPLEELCKGRNIPFEFKSGCDLEKEVALDPAAIAQILFNLVDNACKYGEGKVVLEVMNDDTLITYKVSDQGKGLSSSERDKVFSPFYRGKGSAGKGAGVGLGLALCRRWAREMGGDLYLEKGNNGAFIVKLPNQ